MIVADVRLYREGLAAGLAARKGLEVVGTAGDFAEAVACVAVKPDVVVIDMATRESHEIVRAVARQAREARIIAFAVERSHQALVTCAEAGVAGYAHADTSIDELAVMIGNVRRDETRCSPRLAAVLFRSLASMAEAASSGSATDSLTAREQQILRLISGGGSNKDIAVQLGIELATVKNHVHSILDKLQVATRVEAAACWKASGAEHRPPPAPPDAI